MTLIRGQLDAKGTKLYIEAGVDHESIPLPWKAFAGREILLGGRSSAEDLDQAFLFDAATGCLLYSPLGRDDTEPGNQPSHG